MSDTTKKVLTTVGLVVVAYFALKIVLGAALALLFNVVIPVAVLGGIAYAIYTLFGRKALGGGRKTLP